MSAADRDNFLFEIGTLFLIKTPFLFGSCVGYVLVVVLVIVW